MKAEAVYPMGNLVLNVERSWLAGMLWLARKDHKRAARRIYALNRSWRASKVGEEVRW